MPVHANPEVVLTLFQAFSPFLTNGVVDSEVWQVKGLTIAPAFDFPRQC